MKSIFFHIHWLAFLPALMLPVVVALFSAYFFMTTGLILGFLLAFLMLLGIIAMVAIQVNHNYVKIDDVELESCSGWISKTRIGIDLSNIESTHIHMPLLGRIFNFGSIMLYGRGSQRINLFGIIDPENLVDIVNQRKKTILAARKKGNSDEEQ